MSRIPKIALLLLPFIILFAALHREPGKTYSNPVLVETYSIKRSSPAQYSGTLGIGDPDVIFYKGKYYLYPTGDNHSYDVYLSDDLINWSKGPKVFKTGESGVWAPDIFFNTDDGMFYLYYTVNGRIGVASSERPDGTFKDMGTLVTGAIDAHMFRDDDGAYFLYYARYPEFAIFVQPMASPVRTKGMPVQILSPSEEWEMRDVPVTEAPWILKYRSVYYLLYSGGSANTEHYSVGYATAEHPSGPFTKYKRNPVIHSGNGVLGPGHVSVTHDQAGQFWMVYHQQKDETQGWNRIICIDPLRFNEKGVLKVRATRATPQPAPEMANAGN